MNILYIAYQFPPLNVGGSARPAKFVKYLTEFGVNPTVVTLDPQYYDKVYANAKADSNLLSGENLELDIINVPSDDILKKRKNKFLKFIDIYFTKYRSNEKKAWKKNYTKIVNNYLENHKVSAILVTAPPFGILSLAVATSKRFNIPLIVDMRDPWTMWTIAPYGTYFHFLASKFAERYIFKHASKIIATSTVTIEDFKIAHPDIDQDKFAYIPNGFENEIVFKKLEFSPKQKITIGYVGSFYYSPKSRQEIMMPWYRKNGHRKLQYIPRKEDWIYRTPINLFKSLQILFNKFPELKSMVYVKFAGNKEDWFDGMVKEHSLEDNVSHLGWMSHSESLQFQKSCDFLLATSAKVVGGKDYSVAGKTFEYFTIQKPILAFVSEGAQKDILESSHLAFILPVEDAEKAAIELKDILTAPFSMLPNESFINTFKVQFLTETLSKIIKTVVQKSDNK